MKNFSHVMLYIKLWLFFLNQFFTEYLLRWVNNVFQIIIIVYLRVKWCLQYIKHCFNVFSSVQFSQSCLTLWDPMDCSTPGLPVHHQLLEFTQTHVHWVGDATQPSHLLSSPSPPAFNLSQHQCHFKQVSSSHQVAKVLEFQLQHQSFQWIFRTDFL